MGERGRVRAGAWASAALTLGLCAAVAAAASASDPAANVASAPATRTLHVPSPDWRDQIIYFAMIDRFDDGDVRNNDQGTGEYDPSDNARFNGGDLKGIARRLDYIRGLGATAIWITPPVANQWWSDVSHYGGYHGYWAEDFKRVDAHFGTLRDYQDLSRDIHAAGMYLVQDVVVNHTGNYFGYTGGWDPADPGAHFALHTAAGRTTPTQQPFAMNDARDPRQRAAAIYHWTPDIQDFSDRNQQLNYELAGLDDLNTENPVVRAALRDTYGYWIRAAGVDAFRVDTAFHVPPEYFDDFLHANDRKHPGVLRVAAQTGRSDFHLFGEGFGIDRAFEDIQARRIDSYMRDAQGRALLPAMINFPLYGTLGDVFARGRPTAELGHRIGSMMTVHERPWLMPTFVDNHDVDRFLAGGSDAGLKQALLAIMTLPGIPTIYYGTEQGFTEQRAAMFAQGHGAGGRDHFDTQAPLYRYIQRAAALRRGHRVFSRGVPTVLAANAAAPGAFAYRMNHEGEAALVVFNTAEHATLLDNLDTALAPGTALEALFAIDGTAPKVVVGNGGRVSLVLPPRAGFVWRTGKVAPSVASAPAQIAPAPRVSAPIVLDAGAPDEVRDDFDLHGSAHDAHELKLVIDGDVDAAVPVHVARDGRWRARVDTRDIVDAAVVHTAVLWDAAAGVASPRHAFRVARDWQLRADIADPAGDDAGPSGRYAYPADAGWTTHRQADLRNVTAWTSGGALKVQLQMREITTPWNPPNGFDHVAFTVFLQLPDRADGATVMPLQHATLPDGMRWHYRLRANGWSNVLFDAVGASASNEGTVAAATPRIETDAAQRTVTLIFPARAIGTAASLVGAKLYVTTWDYDGGYRALLPQAQANAFGGREGPADPLVMDDTAVIVLR